LAFSCFPDKNDNEVAQYWPADTYQTVPAIWMSQANPIVLLFRQKDEKPLAQAVLTPYFLSFCFGKRTKTISAGNYFRERFCFYWRCKRKKKKGFYVLIVLAKG
jgi:hypothetical protein